MVERSPAASEGPAGASGCLAPSRCASVHLPGLEKATASLRLGSLQRTRGRGRGRGQRPPLRGPGQSPGDSPALRALSVVSAAAAGKGNRLGVAPAWLFLRHHRVGLGPEASRATARGSAGPPSGVPVPVRGRLRRAQRPFLPPGGGGAGCHRGEARSPGQVTGSGVPESPGKKDRLGWPFPGCVGSDETGAGRASGEEGLDAVGSTVTPLRPHVCRPPGGTDVRGPQNPTDSAQTERSPGLGMVPEAAPAPTTGWWSPESVSLPQGRSL